MPVEALNGVGLHAAYVEVDYDDDQTRARASARRTSTGSSSGPMSPAVEADNNILVG